jgi:hypothetical protein
MAHSLTQTKRDRKLETLLFLEETEGDSIHEANSRISFLFVSHLDRILSRIMSVREEKSHDFVKNQV